VHIASALPFLLLGPLARAGYLDALAATFAASELSSELPLFAAALAYKVLTPTERGWRRSPASVQAAAVFAGLDGAVAEDALVKFSEAAKGLLAPLDAVISESLIEGHNAAQPLLLHQTESASRELWLIDVEGLFPIACANDFESLLPTLMEIGSPALLIASRAAELKLLIHLDQAGIYFITDASPTRYESWRQIRASSEKWWTNNRAAPTSSLAKIASELATAEEEAARLRDELAARRVSVPLASDQSLERSLTLAAAFALGTIAWTLWQKREPTTPRLALERFRDLDARVKFTGDEIEVKLPLGRRRQDLLDHRLLDEIRAVPWLGLRRVRFSGG
jgi:hypothetical protein